MEAKEVQKDELAELKLSIIYEQERLAEFGRSGLRAQARRARDRLYRLLYRKDQLEHFRIVRSADPSRTFDTARHLR